MQELSRSTGKLTAGNQSVAIAFFDFLNSRWLEYSYIFPFVLENTDKILLILAPRAYLGFLNRNFDGRVYFTTEILDL